MGFFLARTADGAKDSAMHDAEKIVQELSAMWNSKDVDRIEALFASDAVHEDMTSGVKLHGASASRDLFAGTWQAIPDVRTEVGRVICQDEWISWEWTMTATHTGDFPNLPATGRAFSIEGVSVLRISGGRVLSQRDYYDQASFLRQVGALPAGN